VAAIANPSVISHATKTKNQPKSGEQPMSLSISGRNRNLLCLVLFLVVAVTFSSSLNNGFVNFDDEVYVTANPHVKTGLTLDNVKWAFQTGDTGNWHPLTWLSHMLDCQIFGLRAWGHHLTALLLHSVNAVLLFLVLTRMTGAMWRSLFVAVVFGLHPLRVESVAWVAERKDVLSTLFFLLTVWCYARYTSVRTARYSYGLALFFFALSLMAKPMMVTLPFLLLLLDYWPLGRFKTKQVLPLVMEKIPFLALTVISSSVTYVVQKQGGTVASMEAVSLADRFQNAINSYGSYLGKIFYPANLCAFYPLPEHCSIVPVLLSLAVVLAVSVVVLVFRRKSPFLPVGWFWFLGTLVPVIGLVQVGRQAMADRYTYVPSIGVFILVAWGAYQVTRSWHLQKIVLGVAASTIVMACAAATFHQIPTWKNSDALFQRAAAVTEENYYTDWVLGTLVMEKGDTPKALELLGRSVELRPSFPDAHESYGVALKNAGRVDEAIPQLIEALRLKSSLPGAHKNLGLALSAKGKLNEAIGEFQAALQADPSDVVSQNGWGNALDSLDRMDEAMEHYQSALKLNPDYVNAHKNFGRELFRMNRLAEARTEFETALRLKSDDAETHNQLGKTLGRLGQTDDAINQFGQAAKLKPSDADIRNNLGVALQSKGRIDEAIEEFREALKLKPDMALARKNLEAATNLKSNPK